MAGISFTTLAAAFALAVMPLSGAAAQISSVDPDAAMQPGDAPVSDSSYYGGGGSTTDQYAEPDVTVSEQPAAEAPAYSGGETTDYVQPDAPGNESPAYADATGTLAAPAPGEPDTYQEDDLIAAGSGVFGDGAEGLARMIERILAEQGEPNGYIVGREAGGAFVLGVRYGSGTLHHRLEGQMPVYWTGPSIGFDFGGNAAQTFVLVYNLHDTDELFQRFPAVEGDAYFIGGLTASYMRSGDKVLIPIRLGAGLRLGANLGYMKFSREQDWVPF
jgi:hypothetical protein